MKTLPGFGLCLMLFVGQVVPAVGQTAPRFDDEQLRIVAVSPQVAVPGDPVRIHFSASPYPNLAAIPSPSSLDMSVEVGGRPAKIASIDERSVTVVVPQNLPVSERLPVRVIAAGRIFAGDHWVIVEAVPLYRRSPWPEATAVSGLAVLAFGFWYWLTVRRRAALRREFDELQFRTERYRTVAAEKLEVLPQVAPAAPTKPLPAPAVPPGLVEALARDECTLFWGAGLSAQASYPTWREALELLTTRLAKGSEDAEIRTLINAGRISLVMELLVTRHGRERLTAELRQLWGDAHPLPKLLSDLAQLQFTNAVTSVWDPMIEEAFAARRPIVVTGVSNDSLEALFSRDAFSIVRLWGALSRPETLLFTENEYRRALAENPTYGKYVASLPLSQTHLFLGASIDSIQEYLAATPRITGRTHYALVPETEGVEAAREVLKARYGVELLVFQPSSGWPQLPAFVRDLVQTVQKQAPPPRATLDTEAFKLKAVRLENIGPFRERTLELDPQWNVLLGNNGAGKSTVLRAIALVLCGDDPRAFAEAGKLLRIGESKGSIELLVGSVRYRTELTRDSSSGVVHVNAGSRISPLKSGRWVALAFPPLRGVSVAEVKGPTTDGVARPVVEDVLPILTGQIDGRLSSLKQWLVNLDVRSAGGPGIGREQAQSSAALRNRFFEVFNAFVPGADVKFAGVDRGSWRVDVTTKGARVPLDQVSQGTSSMLGWVGALMQRMYEIYGADGDLTGRPAVVLIDEIDAHLHPGWQQHIALALSQQFPAVQFIATTHSPLLVGELEQTQVYIVRWKGDEVVTDHPSEPLKGMGVAALLTGESFGLGRALDKETQDLLEQQRRLSAKEVLDVEDKQELERISNDLQKRGFRYDARDPLMAEFLKERYGRVPVQEKQASSREPVTSRVSEMIKSAIAEADRNERAEG